MGQPGNGEGRGQLVPASTPGHIRASGPLTWGDVSMSHVAPRPALQHPGWLCALQQAITVVGMACASEWTIMAPLVLVTLGSMWLATAEFCRGCKGDGARGCGCPGLEQQG